MSSVTTSNKKEEIFETPDLETTITTSHKQEDVKQAKEQKKAEEIVQVSTLPRVAFEKFAGKIFDSSFSDESLRPFVHEIQQTQFVSHRASERSLETPLQRYNRIKTEVLDFKQQLLSIAQSVQGDSKEAVTQVTSSIGRELSQIEHELAALVSNQSFQPFLQQNVSTTAAEQKLVMDRLLAQLQQVSDTRQHTTKDATSSSATNALATYEIYYNPSKEDARFQSNISDLDRRVSQLEKSLGATKDDTLSTYPDIHSALEYLQRRLDLLDQSKLETINRRIKSLLSELETLQQAQTKAQQDTPNHSANNHQQISQVFQMMTRWDACAQALPSIVSRLQSLDQLHQASATAVQRIHSIDAQQAQIDSLLQQDRDALRKVEASLASNSTVFRDNITLIQQRIDHLSAQIAKLQ